MHPYLLGCAHNDCEERPVAAERLSRERREARASWAAVARETLRERGVTVFAASVALNEAPSVTWGRLHGRKPFGPEHVDCFDRADAVAIFEAWTARARRAA